MPQALKATPLIQQCALRKSTVWPFCTVFFLIGYGGIVLLCGADLWALFRFFLAAVFWLWLPGQALATLFAPDAGVRQLFAWVYGAGFLAIVQCLSARLDAFWLLWFCPPLLGLAGMAALPRSWPSKLRRVAQATKRLLFSPKVTFWAALCLAFAVCCSAVNPHPVQAGAVDLDRDFLWNTGNAAALTRNFPAEDLRVSGVRLAYHYLTELLWAALARVSDASLFDVYFYGAGPVFLVGELLALTTLAHCCWPKQPYAPGLFYALVFGFSCLSMWTVLDDGLSLFGNTLLAHLLTNVNAQATSLPFFAGVFCTFVPLARAGMHGNGRQWLGMILSFSLFCVAKGPQAALTLCGLAASWGILLVLRRVRVLPTVAGLAGLAGIFALIYRFLYAAGTGSMEFSLFAMRDTLVYRLLSPLTDRLCALLPGTGYFWLFCLGLCNVFCMLPFQCSLCLYALPAAIRRLPRPDPARLLAAVLGGGGMLAYHLFYHSSSSQIYFALLAMLCLSLLGVGSLGRLFRTGKPLLHLPFWLAGAAGLLTTVCLAISFVGRSLPPLVACISGNPLPAVGNAVTAADENAMQWLMESSDPNDVFATNRISGTPALTDAISNVYTGLSGRQAYLEGWTYAATNMGVSREVLDYKRWINEELTGGGLSPPEAGKIAQQEDIQWLVIAKLWPGNPPKSLAPVYENSDVTIYRLDETGNVS